MQYFLLGSSQQVLLGVVDVAIIAPAGDLKPALTAAINAILKPVRDHFATDPVAKELLKKVKVRLSSAVIESVK